jgi:hypothetical protein
MPQKLFAAMLTYYLSEIYTDNRNRVAVVPIWEHFFRGWCLIQ